MENIRLAHENAKKHKTKYEDVRIVDSNLEFYLKQIQEMLVKKTYKTSPYVTFKRNFNGKEREIFKLPYFPDRIVHHCIMQVIEPIWRRCLIRDTYSSIKGRGIEDGRKRILRAIKDEKNTKYCLKLDIHKFYPSINHNILKDVIRKKIKCRDTLQLLDSIIDSTKGVPIGNYLSQYFGNVYLCSLDHLLKEHYKVRYYYRYCDDLILFASEKGRLRYLLKKLINYCKYLKDLSVKSNYQIFPLSIRGLDFLGYRFFRHYILLRKRIVQNFKKKLVYVRKNYKKMTPEKIINGIMSYYGWMTHANSYNLMRKYFSFTVRVIFFGVCFKLNVKNPLRRIYT